MIDGLHAIDQSSKHSLGDGFRIARHSAIVGLYYLNPASNSVFSCKIAGNSSFSPTILAAVDEV
jgi:hypothetical protein